jgi:hypothetical protein
MDPSPLPRFSARRLWSAISANALFDDDKATERSVASSGPAPDRLRRKGTALLIENLLDVAPPDIPNSFRGGYRSNDATRRARGCLEPFHAIDSLWFRCNYDAGNLLCGGEKPYPPACELPKDYIRKMHSTDAVECDLALHGPPDDVYPQRDRSGNDMRVPVGLRPAHDDAPIDGRQKDGYQRSAILEPRSSGLDNAVRESPAYLAGHGHPAQRSTGTP